MQLLLRGGKVVTDRGIEEVDILIAGEKIKEIGRSLKADDCKEVLDCSGKLVLPGVIDAHVHFNMPCGPDIYTTDDFLSGSISAACGGVTTVIDYIEPLDNQMPMDALQSRRAEADGNSVTDYSLHYVVREWKEKYLDDLEEVIKSGISSFKVFTTYEGMMLSYEIIEKILQWTRAKGVITTFHAEDNEIVQGATKNLTAKKTVLPSYHGHSRPVESEVEAVKRIIEFSAQLDVPVYFVHVSSYKAAQIIQEAQEKGYKILAETCPHYLFLTSEEYKGENPQLFIMSPPLREERERLNLWKAVEKGTFSVIATDHCAFSVEQKLAANTYYETLAGIPGVETLLPLMYSAVDSGKLELLKMVDLLSTNPAKIFGLYPQKGALKKGSDADIVVLDPKKKIELNGSSLHSKAGYTPFEGIELHGYPETTIVRGEIVYRNGLFCGKKGYGQFVPGKI